MLVFNDMLAYNQKAIDPFLQQAGTKSIVVSRAGGGGGSPMY